MQEEAAFGTHFSASIVAAALGAALGAAGAVWTFACAVPVRLSATSSDVKNDVIFMFAPMAILRGRALTAI
jgi:hypothetical protein